MLSRKSLFPKEISAIVLPFERLLPRILPGGDLDDEMWARLREAEELKELDALKGLTYFGDFPEILRWKADRVDPIQRASVPLLLRNDIRSGVEPKLLVVHDYHGANLAHGGYHDYEASGVVGVMEEDFIMERLQSVESFVYYGEHLVNIPPPGWTNLLHKNGVKALGTLYIDRDTYRADTLLEYTVDEQAKRHYVVAGKLAEMAKTYGFDGWLISISKGFDKNSWNLQKLVDFLVQLREMVFKQWMPKRGSAIQIIWHDSLSTANWAAAQNSVTAYNLAFVEACGSVLTGPRWNPEIVGKAVETCSLFNIPLDKVYFAVDVRAQDENVCYIRKTWPREGGGGTNTALAAEKLLNIGKQKGVRLGMAVVGPSWVTEHFSPQDVAKANYVIWDGGRLPDEMACNCTMAGISKHWRQDSEPQGIVKFVCRSPAGTECFLWTDFGLPFAGHDQRQNELYDGFFTHAQLAAQSVAIVDAPTMRIEAQDRLMLSMEGTPPVAVVSIPRSADPFENYLKRELFLPLFELNMPIPRSKHKAPLELRVRYRCDKPIMNVDLHVELGFALGPKDIVKQEVESKGKGKAIEGDVESKDEAVEHESGPKKVAEEKDVVCHDLDPERTMKELKVTIRAPSEALDRDVRLTSMGIRAAFPSSVVLDDAPQPVLEMYSVTIMPFDRDPHGHPPVRVENVRVADRGGAGRTAQKRLEWDLRDAFTFGADANADIPHSPLTGRVAYCDVKWEGVTLAQVYGTQLVMTPEMVRKWENCMGVQVTVTPVAFGGQEWPSTKKTVCITGKKDDPWVWVDDSEDE